MKKQHSIDGLDFTTEIHGEHRKLNWIKWAVMGYAIVMIGLLISLVIGLYVLNLTK